MTSRSENTNVCIQYLRFDQYYRFRILYNHLKPYSEPQYFLLP